MDMATGAKQRESTLYEIIGKKDYRIEELQQENAALRARLDGLLKQQQIINPAPPPALQAETTGHTTSNKPTQRDFDVLSRQYAELDQSFKSLEALHRTCESKIGGLDAKYKNYKQRAYEWYQYAERQKSKVKSTRPSSSSSSRTAKDGEPNVLEREAPRNDADATPRAQARTFVALPARGVQHGEQHGSISPTLRSSPLPMHSSVQGEAPEQTRVPQLRISSSQTTVEGTQNPADATRGQGNGSDEEPEFVSARCLKRKAPRGWKHSSPARRVKPEPLSSDCAIELSSDPPDENARPSLVPQLQAMCSDLDNVPLARPKQLFVQQSGGVHQRAASEDCGRPTPQLQRSESSLSEGDARPEGNARPYTSMGNMVNHRPVDQATEGDTNTTDPTSTCILRPISVNVPRSKRTPNKSSPSCGGASKRGKVGMLSEDGDGSSQINAAPKDVEVPPLRKDDTLDGLLMGHSTDSTPDVARPPPRLARNAHIRTPGQLRTPISAIKLNSPSKRLTMNAVPQGIEAPPAPFRPEDEPLRLRDLRELKLEDFKVNPNYLGSDFAFADTLRGRDYRRALHVCTKPDCCGGALQKAILMGGQKISGKTDAEVLSEYLGPQYKQIMASSGVTRQKDTVLQAHAAAFAERHGKHRQAFERQSTPPGFWRTDFPTTQENLEDRQKARENERRVIEARHREAMRDDGQWIFRDE